MLDIPIGGTIIPKEEIRKAPLLKIEVDRFYLNLSY